MNEVAQVAVPVGRALDELVALKVFGQACIHAPTAQPPELIAERIRRDYAEDFGVEPPAAYVESHVDWALNWSDYPPRWCPKCKQTDVGSNEIFARVPAYSTEISAAWEVVERLAVRVNVHVGVYAEGTDDEGCYCEIGYGETLLSQEWAATVPLAICRAALAFAREEEDA